VWPIMPVLQFSIAFIFQQYFRFSMGVSFTSVVTLTQIIEFINWSSVYLWMLIVTFNNTLHKYIKVGVCFCNKIKAKTKYITTSINKRLINWWIRLSVST
jgi:hypothetical protein